MAQWTCLVHLQVYEAIILHNIRYIVCSLIHSPCWQITTIPLVLDSQYSPSPPNTTNVISIQYPWRIPCYQIGQIVFSFPLSTDIMACPVSNGQFCHINTPLYAADTSKSCSYALFLQNKNKLNAFCTMSVINQTHDQVVNINAIFWQSPPWKAIESFTSLAFSSGTH